MPGCGTDYILWAPGDSYNNKTLRMSCRSSCWPTLAHESSPARPGQVMKDARHFLVIFVSFLLFSFFFTFCHASRGGIIHIVNACWPHRISLQAFLHRYRTHARTVVPNAFTVIFTCVFVNGGHELNHCNWSGWADK